MATNAEDIDVAVETEAEDAAEAAEDTPEGEAEAETVDADDGDDTENIDFGGEKMSVAKDAIPPEIADKLARFTKGTWADYTRKSQAVAEKTKALEARSSAIEKLANMQGEVLDEYSKGLQVKAELEQLRAVDLNTLWQTDETQARRISDAISAKEAQFQQHINTLSLKETEKAEAERVETDRLEKEGEAAAERLSPGFLAEADAVVDYVVKNYGMSKEQASRWRLNPATAVMARKAMLYDKAQAKVTKRPPKPAPTPVKAVKSRGGSGNSSSAPSDKDDVNTWMRKRNAQLRKRAARG